MIQHPVSHLDHSLTAAQISYVLNLFASKKAFFKETIELPAELGTVPCGLFGPIVGDDPVPSVEVEFAIRGSSGVRTWNSRLVKRAPRPSRLLTVIAGPYEDPKSGATFDCILYTAFGGPQAPQEPGDPRLKDEDREASIAFWMEHALAVES